MSAGKLGRLAVQSIHHHWVKLHREGLPKMPLARSGIILKMLEQPSPRVEIKITRRANGSSDEGAGPKIKTVLTEAVHPEGLLGAKPTTAFRTTEDTLLDGLGVPVEIRLVAPPKTYTLDVGRFWCLSWHCKRRCVRGEAVVALEGPWN